jgi:peroxiredoxin
MSQIRIATILASLALSLGTELIAAEVPQVGQQAPAVTLPSQEGGPVSLKDFHGKYVVLYYPVMTQGCTIEAHNFSDLAKYDQSNAVILGVSVVPPTATRNSAPRKHFSSLLRHR